MDSKIIKWILWITWISLLPVKIFGAIFILIMPTIQTLFYGIPLLIFGPPLGILILLNGLFYGAILFLIASITGYLINKVPHKLLQYGLILLILYCSFKVTFIPVYGSGNAWRSGRTEGTTLWKYLGR